VARCWTSADSPTSGRSGLVRSPRYTSSSRAAIRVGLASAKRIARPVAKARARSQSRSYGSDVATSSHVSAAASGSTLYLLAHRSATSSTARGLTRERSAIATRSPVPAAASTASSPTRPALTTASQRLPPGGG
jgi:hypothetical protein